LLKACSSYAILNEKRSTGGKEQRGMAKAITTITQRLKYHPHHADWFAANQVLFNQVVAFYFDVIQAHEQILTLKTKEALTALETLTHTTEKNPNPVLPLSSIGQDIPAMFRRAAINAALGSAKSFQGNLKRWRTSREKMLASGKTFTDRPPAPPRTWNKSVPFYAGLWRERTENSVLLKVWTGACWSWIKVRISGRDLPAGYAVGSPHLIRHGNAWWLHTPLEKAFEAPAKVEEQVKAQAPITICAVDLNLGEHIAVCSVQNAEGTTLSTRFIGGGDVVHGFRKRALGRIARNRRKTGIIASGEQDNAARFQKLRNRNDAEAHRISRRIVQFAAQQGASIIVFEHLGNLKPEKGKYSRRGNLKRAYWMKGRIFQYTKYKAWAERIITSRVSPRNTSRDCARCGEQVIRYAQGWHPQQGYSVGAPLVHCPACQMRGHADRNASIVIGQRLFARYRHPVTQEKPPARRVRSGRVVKATGVIVSQDAQNPKQPSLARARHGDRHEHGTAQEKALWMEQRPPSFPAQLRLFCE
jgi:IS605 OrfB family transposase